MVNIYHFLPEKAMTLLSGLRAIRQAGKQVLQDFLKITLRGWWSESGLRGLKDKQDMISKSLYPAHPVNPDSDKYPGLSQNNAPGLNCFCDTFCYIQAIILLLNSSAENHLLRRYRPGSSRFKETLLTRGRYKIHQQKRCEKAG